MDIDIDVKPNTNVEELFSRYITFASMLTEDKTDIKKHNVGVYFQNIPKDPKTELSAITYDNAEKFGYFKIDVLSLKILEYFNSKNDLKKMMKKEPDWNMLLNRKIVEQLFHLANNFDVVYSVKPKNVLELADCLALIRPGKKYLLNKYIKQNNKNSIRKILYKKEKPSDLRKSHALPYAYLIIAQLNLLREERI